MGLNAANAILTVIYWLVWSAVALSITFITWYIYWKTTRSKRLIDKLPGFKDWPLVGDFLHLELEPAGLLKQLLDLSERDRASGILKLKVFEMPWLFIYSSRVVEALLSSSKHIDKSYEYFPLHPWLGMGLLTSSGNAWRARRHMLTPSFHFSILKDFLEVINEHSVKLADTLRERHCDTGVQFDIFKPITLSTLDIICCTAMGVDVSALENGDSEYVKSLSFIKRAADERPNNPLYHIDMIYNFSSQGRRANKCIDVVHQFAYKVIRERREMKQAGNCQTTGKRRPFLDLLLECQDEEGNHLTEKELREEVDTFMFEGHDTTSSAISFAIYLLGSHKDIQRKCQMELDEVLDCSTNISSGDLAKLTYLECCIKESLRIFPPITFYGRSLAEELKLGDYFVPKGATVLVLSAALHRDPEVFPEPEKFDPTRFTPENCTKRSPFAYVPFSAGPRNCIGQKFAMMELKIVIATLLRNFDIESVQTREELKINPSLVIQPADGIQIKLTRRH